MKHLLVITYYWPPSGGAGVQRWLKFAKYLRDFGWEPTIYTPENPEYPETDNSLYKDIPENIRIVKRPIWEPYNAYKKLIRRKKNDTIKAAFLSESKKQPLLENFSIWLRGNFFIPDARKFWIRPSVRFLRKYLSENTFHAIISTGPPHSMHMIALGVAERAGIPWLADFRDPWTNIDFYKDLHLTRPADRKHHRMEKQVLSNATAVTVISAGMAADFARIYNRNYTVITNGFDEADTETTIPVILDQKFSIAHIGTLVSTRNPVTLWTALKDLAEKVAGFRENLEIKLVGKVDYTVMESLASFGLEACVRRIDYLPHDQVTRVQQESRVLLLIINNTPNASLILTGKFFEYMAAKRPILCIGPVDGDAAKILNQTGTGLLAGFCETETLKSHLLTLYQQFLSQTPWHPSDRIQPFSRRELTRKLANLLDEMTV